MVQSARRSNAISSIKSALADAIDDPARSVLQLSGIANYLAVETVRRRERVCGRLIVDESVVDGLRAAITGSGLICRVAKFRLVELVDVVPGTHHNGSFRYDNCGGAKSVVYFAIDAAFAAGIEEAEIRAEHQLVGQLFGYPSCCVESFLAGDQDTADRIPRTIPHTGPFPAIMNPVLPYLYPGLSLLFHFPCSPECQASQLLAKRRLESLTRGCPEAGRIPLLGRGIALYAATVGVALVTRYRCIGPDEFECEEILTRDGLNCPAFVDSSRAARLRLLGPHKFVAGDQIVETGHQFAARFDQVEC
ncbi:MAG: hypothetical protein GEU82_15085 [Luteitalea sp.]|nr:hypothetical protein [Luteitalea sp.]